MEITTPDNKRKQFLWGVTLAWIPFFFLAIPTVRGIYHAFQSAEKATGLGIIGDGLLGVFATFGLVVTGVFELLAVYYLLRSIHGGRAPRTMVAAFSLCCSVVMLAVAGLFVWLRWGGGPQ